MPKFRIVTNGNTFRVQRKVACFWFNEFDLEFLLYETAQSYIDHETRERELQRRPWRVVTPSGQEK